MATDESNNILLKIESNDDIMEFKHKIKQLVNDVDCYKQQIHKLQLQIQLETGMKNELQETIDNMEECIKREKNEMNIKINEIEEKHGTIKKELILRLAELENEIEEKSKKNRELQDKLIETNKLLLVARIEKSSVESSIKNESIIAQKTQIINELSEKLLYEENERKSLEQIIESMSKEQLELKEIFQINKAQLAERNEILETTRDELNECRIELETVKHVPTNEMNKGNSLFAEVEDRRKKYLERMAEMKKYYYDAKRCINNKDNEIKALKFELAALLNKQKDDAENCIQENGELLDKYKDRILELETKLLETQKKYRKLELQKEPTDNSFSYFQAVLDAKRKEIEELEAKLENKSLQSLIQEEIKLKTNRQMRYWRNKAMSYEAQIEKIKCRLNTNHSLVEAEELFKLIQRDCPTKNSQIEESLMDPTEKSLTVIDETIVTIDELIEIPKIQKQNVPTKTEFNLSIANKQSSKTENQQDNSAIINERFCHEIENENKENEMADDATVKNKDKEKGKKVLRFAEGTTDPQPKKLRRHNTPNYSILHVPSKSKE
ncbi:hypothetical protein PV327_010609 [Microctonus hyperodae]|uniref:Protein Spindly n=1 Tax=Microctonus hyperodae TaxID=165561 RepID=A0AA39KV51_MICHY|nr:hypothetical protein PV327_010609 [Microctonus hyperodae]